MKRILATILVLSMAISGTLGTLAVQADATGEWQGEVDTNAPMSRGDFARALVLMAGGVRGPVTGVEFLDVTPEEPCYLALQFLTSCGVARGSEDGTFRPNEAITFGEAAAMASRMLTEETYIIGIAPYPVGHMLYAADAGLLKGVSILEWNDTPDTAALSTLLTNVSGAVKGQREQAVAANAAYLACLGMDRDKALSALGVGETQILKGIKDGTTGEEKIALIEKMTYYARPAKVELQMKNGIFYGVQVIFNGGAGDELTAKTYAAASYHYAKQLREQVAENYGKPNTTHGGADCLDELSGPEAFQAALESAPTDSFEGEGWHVTGSRVFREGWTVGRDAALAATLFGEQTAALWDNEVGLMVSLNNLTQYGNNPKTTSVTMSLCAPLRELVTE